MASAYRAIEEMGEHVRELEAENERLREALAAQTANCQRLIDRVAELGGFTDVAAETPEMHWSQPQQED